MQVFFLISCSPSMHCPYNTENSMCVCVALQICDTHGMCIRPSISLCSSSLVHTSILSLQLLTLLSQLRLLCVFVCAHGQAYYGLNPYQPGIPLCLSEGIWSGACCQPGPCITFKEVSVCPSPYHSSSTPPPALACWGSPWYAWHAHFVVCVLKVY